jgi:hypothetical protein
MFPVASFSGVVEIKPSFSPRPQMVIPDYRDAAALLEGILRS